MTAESFWQSVSRRLDAGTPVFVSLVAANTRASPGTLGAHLLVDANGEVEGTIGGGIMERKLIADASERLREQSDALPELQRFIHRKDSADASGLICAGEQTNINLILLPPRDAESIQRFCAALANQNELSANLVIDADGVRVADTDEDDTSPGTIGLLADGDHWQYRQNSVNARRLAIIGAGHCGRALASLAAQIGYWLDVFDTRADVLHQPGWPDTVRLHPLNDYAELDSRLRRKSMTTVVVMTTAIHDDIAALAAVANDELRWLGVMGSKAKIHDIRAALRERGIASERIDAIHGPIGLPMKSDTPPEIAVSIMGQLLSEPTQTAGHSTWAT